MILLYAGLVYVNNAGTYFEFGVILVFFCTRKVEGSNWNNTEIKQYQKCIFVILFRVEGREKHIIDLKNWTYDEAYTFLSETPYVNESMTSEALCHDELEENLFEISKFDNYVPIYDDFCGRSNNEDRHYVTIDDLLTVFEQKDYQWRQNLGYAINACTFPEN